MRYLRHYRELVLDNHIKMMIIDLTEEVLVSADVPALPWCFEVHDELRIGDSGLLYSVVSIPEVGSVELAGYRVLNEVRIINVKFKVNDANTAVSTYYRIIDHLGKACSRESRLSEQDPQLLLERRA